MSKVMPRLTIAGFARTLPERVNSSMLDFYLARYSQTNTARGKMFPLAWLIANYGNDPSRISSEMGSALRTYLNGVFQEAVVEIEPDEDGSRLNLKATIMVREDGIEYSFGHVIRISQSKLQSVFDMVNDGIFYDPLKDIQ